MTDERSVRVSSLAWRTHFWRPGRRIASGPAFPQTEQTKQTRAARDRSNKGKALIGFSKSKLFVCILIVPVLALCSFSFICCLRISGNK